MATGIATNRTSVYYGPSTTTYPSENSYVGPSETVTILWKEGLWYYIEYNVGSTDLKKRMYIVSTALSSISGTVTSKSLSGIVKTSSPATIYAGPGSAYAQAGSVETEYVTAFNEVYGSYTFIEYSISIEQKKRGYINTGNLSGASKTMKDPINPSSNYNYGIHKDYAIVRGTSVYAMCDGTATYQYSWGQRGSDPDQYISLGIGIKLTPDTGWITSSGLTASYIEYGHLRKCPYTCPTIAYSKTESGIQHPYKLWEGIYPCSSTDFTNKRTILLGSVHVTAGQYLGESGSTGNSTGPHLHIEFK